MKKKCFVLFLIKLQLHQESSETLRRGRSSVLLHLQCGVIHMSSWVQLQVQDVRVLRAGPRLLLLLWGMGQRGVLESGLSWTHRLCFVTGNQLSLLTFLRSYGLLRSYDIGNESRPSKLF